MSARGRVSPETAASARAAAALVTAIMAADYEWQRVCADFNDVAAWAAHRAAQALVNDARGVYTRARVAEQLARRSQNTR